MAILVPTLETAAAPRGFGTPWGPSENVWQAPLVPVALAATAGVILDRVADISLAVSLAVLVAGLVAWARARSGRPPGLALVCLWASVAAFGAAYHHWRRDVFPADDIGNFATAEPRPVRLRGVIWEGPAVHHPPGDDPLRSFNREDYSRAVLEVTRAQGRDDWLAVSGKVRLTVAGQLTGLYPGDAVEVVGRLTAPQGPANPGETDPAGSLQDRGIRADVSVRNTPDGVTRLSDGGNWSLAGRLAAVRGWGLGVLQRSLPADQTGVAAALLLGENSAMTADHWERYMRTGVLHVLAISGQHLVVLALFWWWVLRLAGVRRKRGAVFVALFLLGYALLTGGRPPVLRSAVAVCAVCGGLAFGRPVLPANVFALAWLVVLGVNPTDLAGPGCQLSFLAVAILCWGTNRWLAPGPLDEFERLKKESRPRWQRPVFWLGRTIAISYGITALVWLALMPLLAARYHLVSPGALLIGPPVTLFSSLALIAGFLLLLAAAVCPFLTPLFAYPTRWLLGACDGLTGAAASWPGSHFYVGNVPDWWLAGFYVALLAVLTLQTLRPRWRWAVTAAGAWLCLGLVGGSARPASTDFRCTFLSVGHGGCAVLEIPDGRTLLYDAGAITGPDVTRRHIAPYLWHRGVRRIDEVFLSHADLDHFNGIPALLERFAVGQITGTPTFADKPTRGVRHTLTVIERRGIPMRTARAGDRLTAGPVEIEVLHPPAAGPEGNENARSLVLLVRHAGHALLLTGDVEGPGLDRLLKMAPIRVDVLMAPHHGSRTANPAELADWARPRVAVSCQGPVWGVNRPEPYSARGALFLPTWPHGAVTVTSRPGELVVETFRTGQRVVFPAAESP